MGNGHQRHWNPRIRPDIADLNAIVPPIGAAATALLREHDHVHLTGFGPTALLVSDVELVISSDGGGSTVLSILNVGPPTVLLPMGLDKPTAPLPSRERGRLRSRDSSEVGAAVIRILGNDTTAVLARGWPLTSRP